MVNTALTSSMTTRRAPSDPRSFGRREPFAATALAAPAPLLSDDLKLFLLTYVAGFVFVSLYLA
jgi:hypothetical protein